jgi:ferredoxin
MSGIPVIDLSECRNCDVCIATSPMIFRRNTNGGYIEVVDLPKYPAPLVNEAIKNCPLDCISWET